MVEMAEQSDEQKGGGARWGRRGREKVVERQERQRARDGEDGELGMMEMRLSWMIGAGGGLRCQGCNQAGRGELIR